MHYAAEYAYGRVAVNHGNRADALLAFRAKALRDEWVERRSTDYITDGGYREELTLREARSLFGSRAVRDARDYGETQTHICDGQCR
jgi:hypothetical protein